MSHSVGSKIKELRKRKNLSQSELAKMVGCGQSTLAHWEIEKGRLPGNKFLSNVANILGVSVDYLLGVENESEGVPFYGDIAGKQFQFPKKPISKLKVTEKEYKTNRFAIKIKNNLLEPVIEKNDYCIFEKAKPKDNDIVIVQEENKDCSIKNWKQEEDSVALSNINIREAEPTIFVDIETKNTQILYIKKSSRKAIKVLGVLVIVRRTLKVKSIYPQVKYIFY